MTSKTRKAKDSLTFDEYKTIKDEIIEISEQRFENILTKRLREFKNSLMEELNVKFDAINTKFDTKFSSLEKRMTFLTWFLPVFITLLMLTLKFFDK